MWIRKIFTVRTKKENRRSSKRKYYFDFLNSSDGPDSAALLGTLDSAFLFSYGAAMFVSGLVAVSQIYYTCLC